MGLVNENLKACGVKIEVNVNGVRSFGSGVVYETPNYCNYNYVLTAKHIFQEDSRTDFSYNNISDLTISYNEKDKLKKLQHIKRIQLNNKLIVFEEDLIIIIINKNPAINFRQILVTDDLTEEDNKFTSWAFFSGNEDEINKFTFERYDPELRRLKLVHSPSIDSLPGISGGGVFVENKYILYGIVSRYPNNNFELKTVDCVKIDFKLINERLKRLNRVQLDTKSSSYKREIQRSVVDIHQAFINGVCLNLEAARKRLKHDIIDDWYHDPLQYIDLCNQDYLFKEFEPYFNSENYKASEAEVFYIPKKQYTLRQALISPFIDRIIYMAVVGVLAEKIENSMIPYVYSARYNKYNENSLIINGVEQWKKMQYAMSEKTLTKDNNDAYKYQCVLEVDLLNYYDNINKKLLIEKINRICETPNERYAAELLNKILFDFSNKDCGLPQNSDASSLLATFYLNQVDLYMQNRTFAYYRFMDDIRIFCTDKYEARKILQELEYELRRCYLSVNSQKTKILLFDDQNLKTINNDCIINRSKFRDIYNLELNKISRLRKTNNYAYLNESFHESIKLLEKYINNDTANEEGSKELNYALNTLEHLGRKDINIYHQDTKFEKLIITITQELIDKP